MLFNSLTFLVFLALVLALYNLPLGWPAKKGMLLVASYLFYSAWNPLFVWLLVVSTLADWWLAARIYTATTQGRRRLWLAGSLAVNLGLLGYFKYAGFLAELATDLAAAMGLAYQAPALDIILPLGISFFTFQTLSYTLDVYFGRMRPWHSFLDYALYVSFFPQLVAGPIVRAKEFLPQLAQAKRSSAPLLGWGAVLLTIGLFEKTVLADDLLAPLADAAYGAPGISGAAAWVGTLAFSGQIFFDFAGYSTCAIGVGLMLGFALPRNFRFPYAAVGLRDFWNRWHISLSQWLRDYLYIPLGGNRKGLGRTQRNLMITMLLGGLWHGASWNFVIWGGLHGLYLVVEGAVRRRSGLKAAPTWRPVLAVVTFLAVTLAWVFFRADSLPTALSLLGAMLLWREGVWPFGQTFFVVAGLLLIGLMLLGHWWLRERDFEQTAKALPAAVQVLALSAMLFLILATPGENKAFIYFQF